MSEHGIVVSQACTNKKIKKLKCSAHCRTRYKKLGFYKKIGVKGQMCFHGNEPDNILVKLVVNTSRKNEIHSAYGLAVKLSRSKWAFMPGCTILGSYQITALCAETIHWQHPQ